MAEENKNQQSQLEQSTNTTVEQDDSSKDNSKGSSKKNSEDNSKDNISKDNSNIDADNAKQLQLVMKIYVNLGMDDYYKVLDLNDKTVTYSFYNYENADTPKLDRKTVDFSELMKIEQGVRKYLVYMYLEDGSKETELNMSEDFIKQVENNPEFRIKLGNVLNKPFSKNLLNNTITLEDIL
jgi:hypothetical protein